MASFSGTNAISACNNSTQFSPSWKWQILKGSTTLRKFHLIRGVLSRFETDKYAKEYQDHENLTKGASHAIKVTHLKGDGKKIVIGADTVQSLLQKLSTACYQ